MSDNPNPINDHLDAIEEHHRFKPIQLSGELWDFAHLEPFAFRAQLNEQLTVDVLVLFSCHCFTHERAKDPRLHVPTAEFYTAGNETRVLNRQRYELSKTLPTLVRALYQRRIRVVGGARPNYFTVEITTQEGKEVSYTLFFQVIKDQRRRKRILLRVQTAYVMEEMSAALREAGKVNFPVLLKAIYEGRKIKAKA